MVQREPRDENEAKRSTLEETLMGKVRGKLSEAMRPNPGHFIAPLTRTVDTCPQFTILVINWLSFRVGTAEMRG